MFFFEINKKIAPKFEFQLKFWSNAVETSSLTVVALIGPLLCISSNAECKHGDKRHHCCFDYKFQKKAVFLCFYLDFHYLCQQKYKKYEEVVSDRTVRYVLWDSG